jgi:hypothetical protein
MKRFFFVFSENSVIYGATSFNPNGGLDSDSASPLTGGTAKWSVDLTSSTITFTEGDNVAECTIMDVGPESFYLFEDCTKHLYDGFASKYSYRLFKLVRAVE